MYLITSKKCQNKIKMKHVIKDFEILYNAQYSSCSYFIVGS